MNYLFLSIFLLVQIIVGVDSLNSKEKGWKLRKEEDGIKVFSRDREGSNFKEIKITCTLKTTASGLVHALSIKEDFTKWIYACSESRLLKEISATETIHYQVTDAPWPVDDRDLIVHTKVVQNSDNGVIDIIGKGIYNYTPVNRNKVRVPKYEAHWIITPKNKNTMDIVYLIAVDPGGSLPAWVVNLGLSDGPLKTMKNLKSRLPQYQDVKIPYIKDIE
mgnify:CR=1 FL=1